MKSSSFSARLKRPEGLPSTDLSHAVFVMLV